MKITKSYLYALLLGSSLALVSLPNIKSADANTTNNPQIKGIDFSPYSKDAVLNFGGGVQVVTRDNKKVAQQPIIELNHAKLLNARVAAQYSNNRQYALGDVGLIRTSEESEGTFPVSVVVKETSHGADLLFTWSSHGARLVGPPDVGINRKRVDAFEHFGHMRDTGEGNGRADQKSGALVVRIGQRFFVNLLEGGNLFVNMCDAMWFGVGGGINITENLTVTAGIFRTFGQNSRGCTPNYLANHSGVGVAIRLRF